MKQFLKERLPWLIVGDLALVLIARIDSVNNYGYTLLAGVVLGLWLVWTEEKINDKKTCDICGAPVKNYCDKCAQGAILTAILKKLQNKKVETNNKNKK